MNNFSLRRVMALCKKEIKQILRDPSSGLIAVVIPILLLLIFGYGISLDSNKINMGVLTEQTSIQSDRFIETLQGSPYINVVSSTHRRALYELLEAGDIRGILIIPADFAQQYALSQAEIQLITDGSEPNIAHFVQAYLQGAWLTWQQQNNLQEGHLSLSTTPAAMIAVEARYWFNPAANSRYFIIPGAITIIMTVICSILTSLVIAREWERGTMEGLLSTPMTRFELLLSKLLPYYLLGLLALAICLIFSFFILHVPYRGSWSALFLLSSLFLLTVLGMGLLISTITRNQFNAAVIALNAAFLPAVMLSGFVFEINSMPWLIRLVTYIIPARYFVNTLQTLFLVGDVFIVLLINGLFLLGFALIMIVLVMKKTKQNMD